MTDRRRYQEHPDQAHPAGGRVEARDASGGQSMEDVLSSIRQIIAEDKVLIEPETGAETDTRSDSRADTRPDIRPDTRTDTGDAYLGRVDDIRDDDDILRLANRIDDPQPIREIPEAAPYRSSRRADPGARPPEAPTKNHSAINQHEGLVLSYEPSLSAERAFSALNSALDMRQPVGPTGKTVDSLLMELMLPMLREWMDANLPRLVERLVHDEISRITSEADR